MHEFSIALNIIDIATEEARKVNAVKITDLEIEVGQVSGVVKEALEFALESAVKNTILEGTRIVILDIPAVALCTGCGLSFHTDGFFSICPACGEIADNIISGRELKVKTITI